MDEQKPKYKPSPGTRITALWQYVSGGVWDDPRHKWWINMLRTANLSVRSFFNRDIQTQACSMTYQTMLAIIPALAMLLAIGRGFGMQDVLKEELFQLFPAQKVAVAYALNFVDTYLTTASEGIFVGVGIVFLLYTLISLLINVEDIFNLIWGVREGRSIGRKLTDYTAILFILPVIMLCVSGLSLLMNSTLDSIFHFSFMTPLTTIFVEGGKWLMTILFFTAAYITIPNTKVSFKYALISGTLAGIGFLVVQWLFVTGTLYVTRYNAIYGSFAFLPLLLLWLQLVWVICLAGAVVCYSSQNVFAFSLDSQVENISEAYRFRVLLAIATVVTHRFVEQEHPATARQIMARYTIPARLVTELLEQMIEVDLVNRVLVGKDKEDVGYQLAVDPSVFTAGMLVRRIYGHGTTEFIKDLDAIFTDNRSTAAAIEGTALDRADSILISSLTIDKSLINPQQ